MSEEGKIIIIVYDNDIGVRCLRTVASIISNMKQRAIVRSTKALDENDGYVKKIKKLDPDLILVLESSKILRNDLLDICPVVGFHPAKLPKYRGNGVYYHLIKDSLKITYCTMYYYDNEIDHGDIIAQRSLDILEDETSLSLKYKVIDCYISLIYEYLPKVLDGKAPRIPQNHNESTVCKGITPKMGILDLNQPGYLIEREIRALEAYSKGYIYGINGSKIYLKVVAIED